MVVIHAVLDTILAHPVEVTNSPRPLPPLGCLFSNTSLPISK